MKDIVSKKEFLEKVDNILDQLMSNQNLSVNHVADELHIQVQQLRRLLILTTGFTSSEYIKNYRIERAKKLLINYNFISVAKIGFMCGFDEPTHFSRFFKHITGITPLEYRKQIFAKTQPVIDSEDEN